MSKEFTVVTIATEDSDPNVVGGFIVNDDSSNWDEQMEKAISLAEQQMGGNYRFVSVGITQTDRPVRQQGIDGMLQRVWLNGSKS